MTLSKDKIWKLIKQFDVVVGQEVSVNNAYFTIQSKVIHILLDKQMKLCWCKVIV